MNNVFQFLLYLGVMALKLLFYLLDLVVAQTENVVKSIGLFYHNSVKFHRGVLNKHTAHDLVTVDCLILNDTRVIPARLYGAKKEPSDKTHF